MIDRAKRPEPRRLLAWVYAAILLASLPVAADYQANYRGKQQHLDSQGTATNFHNATSLLLSCCTNTVRLTNQLITLEFPTGLSQL